MAIGEFSDAENQDVISNFSPSKAFPIRFLTLTLNISFIRKTLPTALPINSLRKLKQTLIKKLEDSGIQVVILYQGEEKWLDKETLQSGELNFGKKRSEPVLCLLALKLRKHKTFGRWQQLFCRILRPNLKHRLKTHFIIDAEFLNQPYQEVFSPFLFNIAKPQYLSQTRLFLFLQVVGKGLENIVIASDKISVRVDWLLQAVGVKDFINYFRPQWE